MTILITCQIRPDGLPSLRRLRLLHLRYIEANRALIRFGGPSRGPDGLPLAMHLVVETTDIAAAEAFIAAEPYTASGEVFASVTMVPWSQVLPETHDGALAAEIAAEASRQETGPSMQAHHQSGATR